MTHAVRYLIHLLCQNTRQTSRVIHILHHRIGSVFHLKRCFGNSSFVQIQLNVWFQTLSSNPWVFPDIPLDLCYQINQSWPRAERRSSVLKKNERREHDTTGCFIESAIITTTHERPQVKRKKPMAILNSCSCFSAWSSYRRNFSCFVAWRPFSPDKHFLRHEILLSGCVLLSYQALPCQGAHNYMRCVREYLHSLYAQPSCTAAYQPGWPLLQFHGGRFEESYYTERACVWIHFSIAERGCFLFVTF